MYYNLYKLTTIQDLENIIAVFFKYYDKEEENKKSISNSNSNCNSKIFDKLKVIIDNFETEIFTNMQEKKNINNINIIKYTNLKKIFSFSHHLNNYSNHFYCLIEVFNSFFKDIFFTNAINVDYKNINSDDKSLNIFDYINDNANNNTIDNNTKSNINYDNLNSIFENKEDIFILNKFIRLANIKRNYYDISILNIDKIIYNNVIYDVNEILLLYIILSLNILKTGGNSIISLDLNKITKNVYLEILFFLSCIFKNIVICKPKCSILDERIFYIACKDKNHFFKDELINITIPVFQNIIEKPKNKYTYSFLKYDIPLFYKNKLNETLINFERYEIELFDHMCSLLLSSDVDEKIDVQNTKQKLRLNNWLQENLKKLKF